MKIAILLIISTSTIISGSPWNTQQKPTQVWNNGCKSSWPQKPTSPSSSPWQGQSQVSNSQGWGNRIPTENLVKPGATWSRPLPTQQNWNNANLVKPVFSAWPGRPQQQQQQWTGSISNENLVKPVFSAWPGRPQQSQQGWQSSRPQQTQQLVDVPFTVEIVQNSQKPSNSGWSRF